MISLRPVARTQTISTQDFLKEYKEKEMPLVMEELTKEWPAKEMWSMEYFESLVGEQEVKLYDSEPSRDTKLQHAAQTTMPIKKYFEMLRNGEKDLRMFFFDILREAPVLREDFTFPEIGLKLFKKLPVMFVGGKGAKVQMHFDIDYADILLCHFGGKKKVMLFPPEMSKYMYHVPYSFSALFDVKFDAPDYVKYPALKHLKGVEAELNHGDVLYVPPGWWHYITYEEIGYSMAIRAFPRKPKNLYRMLKNLLYIRSVDGLMRMIKGQSWNDANEVAAVTQTHENLGLK